MTPNNITTITITISKAIVKMPVLLTRTLEALTPEQRDAFISAFNAEQAKVAATSAKVKALGIVGPTQPNFTRDTERLVAGLSKRKSADIPDIGGEPMGSYHPLQPTKPAFDGLTRGEYFARKTQRQNATKVKGK